MSEPTEPTAKVLFRVPNDDGSAEVETLWAFDLGDDKYKIDNCPFYAYGVSLHDVVSAPFDATEQFPTFVKVLSKSGNRTVRVIFETSGDSERVMAQLVALGCDFEGANPRYVVVNIPPSVALSAVVGLLETLEVTWEHADPTYSEAHPDEA